jgi:hypothetical protein
MGQIITNVTQMKGNGVGSPPEVKVTQQVERVSQELMLNQYSSSTCMQDTYRTGDLNLVTDATALRVVVCFILDMALRSLTVYIYRLHVCVIVLRFLGLGLVIYCGRNLAEPNTRVPHLEYDIKNLPVDLPRCSAQDVQSSIREFEIAQR